MSNYVLFTAVENGRFNIRIRQFVEKNPLIGIGNWYLKWKGSTVTDVKVVGVYPATEMGKQSALATKRSFKAQLKNNTLELTVEEPSTVPVTTIVEEPVVEEPLKPQHNQHVLDSIVPLKEKAFQNKLAAFHALNNRTANSYSIIEDVDSVFATAGNK